MEKTTTTIKINEIPDYLKNSEFYLNLEITNNEIFSNELISNFSSNYKSDQHDKILSIFEDYGPILEIDCRNNDRVTIIIRYF